MKIRTTMVYLLFVTALSCSLLVTGCSQDSGTKNKDTVKAGDPASSKEEPTGSKTENNEDPEKSSVMSQQDAYAILDKELSVPLFEFETAPSGFKIERQLPDKPNPEVLGEKDNKEATLTYVGDEKTIVLTFGVEGDLGDVETVETEIAGHKGTMYQSEADGKQVVYYAWSVQSGSLEVPYSLQFSGVDIDEAFDLAAGLRTYEAPEKTEATETTSTTAFELDVEDDDDKGSSSTEKETGNEYESEDDDGANQGGGGGTGE